MDKGSNPSQAGPTIAVLHPGIESTDDAGSAVQIGRAHV